MDDLYVIEFNWRRKWFHFEPLKRRLVRNLSQLIKNGRPNADGWVLVLVCKRDEIPDALEKLERYFIHGHSG
jgi:hypothetical protein